MQTATAYLEALNPEQHALDCSKDDLHLVVPQRFFVHSQHAPGDRQPLRLQDALHSEKLLGLFERTA